MNFCEKAAFDNGMCRLWADEMNWLAGGWQICLGYSLHNKAMNVAITQTYRAMFAYYCGGAPESPIDEEAA